MSLQPQPPHVVPPDTARVARAIYPKGNLYMQVFDALGGELFTQAQFTEFYPKRGQGACSPVQLATVTLLQFAENLSDRQAADAVRNRIDWKYVLGLELTDSGFDHTVLSEFRTRLIEGQAEQLLFNTLLAQFREKGLIRARGRQRTDSTHVLAAVRSLNRLERVGETLRQALNTLAVVVGEWLVANAPEGWWERYSTKVENYKLPKAEAERQHLASQIAEDGLVLLELIAKAGNALAWLSEIPALQTLRQVWEEQFVSIATAAEGDQPENHPKTKIFRLKTVKELPATSQQIASPYDTEARYSTKRGMEWVGYKVHLTETCDEDKPHLLVNVETTVATEPDDNALASIHQNLKAKNLLPETQIVDSGYTSAQVLVSSQKEFEVEVVGPLAIDGSWQAKAGEGFDKSHFRIDWEAKKVTCPAGKESRQWKVAKDAPTHPIKIRWAHSDCLKCEVRARCTKTKNQPREISLHGQEQHEVTVKMRQQQMTPEFKTRYGQRAGVEGTVSQAVRASDVRHARYIGLTKTHFQQLGTAAGINLIRLGNWLTELPVAKTRSSPFARLKLAS